GLQLTLDKFEIEREGYIKIDILSNRGLGQLWDIEKRHLSDYDYSDLKTYEILSKGEVIGLTYSESRAMMKIFMEMKPGSVDHIAEALALVRPSASQNYQKSDYLKNFHLILNSIETRQKYLIYDDDAIDYIQRVLRVNESIADTYRKAFAKNDKEKKYEFLVMLAKANPELSDDERIAIHDQLNRLNTYSFCKSHAYSYARLVYALAYHKVHNPQKFWLAALNNCQSSFRRWVHFREACLSGIELVYGKGPWIFEKPVSLKTSDSSHNFQESYERYEKERSENLVKREREREREKEREKDRDRDKDKDKDKDNKMLYKLKPIKFNKIKSKNEETREDYDISVAEGMLRWKYWIGPSFYPGMYYRSAKLQGLKPSIITDLLERCCDAKRKILKTLVLKTVNNKDKDGEKGERVAFFK
ncbi:MAG: hypothetical protein WD512_05350, partial [Candidatus Paceibacterota bacterium]